MNAVQSKLCGSMYSTIAQALLSQNLNPADVMPQSFASKGCSRVSSFGNPIQRFAYKFTLNLTPSQWAQVAPSLVTRDFVVLSHVMCGSTVYYQSAVSPFAGVLPNLDPTSSPSWLDASKSQVCYLDANEAIKTWALSGGA